jgi:hypothetical protein
MNFHVDRRGTSRYMEEISMKVLVSISGAALALAAVAATPSANHSPALSGVSPALQSAGALAFGPPGVLYVADRQAATIFAIELAAPKKSAPGTKAIDDIDSKIAAMLGTAAAEIVITDLAVDPRSGNSYLSVTRGTGTDAKPVLMRVDGDGTLEVVSTESLKFTSVVLPNAPDANPAARTDPRSNAVTDMAYQDGKLFVAGLSNEEFSSKLYSYAYPFTTADRGTSVEIFHGNHGRLETRSPVYTFVPYTVDGKKNLIAGYLCTPLVKFPVEALAPGAKITGTTIAELGNRNRPIDMIVYTQGGKDYLLMSNTARGVMKIPTEKFATETPIVTPVPTGTAGVGYETIASLTGVQQLDKLDATRAVMIVKTATGLNLTAVALP